MNDFRYRSPEELYDFESDPNALNNLIDDPDQQTRISVFRSILLDWMEGKEDPILEDQNNRFPRRGARVDVGVHLEFSFANQELFWIRVLLRLIRAYLSEGD